MSHRLLSVNHLVKKELSQIILREISFPKEVLVTVTRVITTADLRQSKVYISVFPENKAKEMLEILNKQIYNLQQRLNQRLKMKPVPKICFIEEKTTAAAGRIEEILAQLKKTKKYNKNK
ncbi:MAG: 30S ribosome-binding factor RbfA [Minisyncoccales bacterium]